MKTILLVILGMMLFVSRLFGNPIPVYPWADMPYEDLNITIEMTSGTLRAFVCGEYTFTYIEPFMAGFYFPVPPDTDNIHVWEESLEIPWEWTTELEFYHTWIPESVIWQIPLFKWEGPFPSTGALYRVEYEYDLIPRSVYLDYILYDPDYLCVSSLIPPDIKEYVFIYSFSTGSTSHVPTQAEIDILLPDDYFISDVLMVDLGGISTRCSPVSYQVVGCHLLISLDSIPEATLYVSLVEKGMAAKPLWKLYE
jgi:hypothetical protein